MLSCAAPRPRSPRLSIPDSLGLSPFFFKLLRTLEYTLPLTKDATPLFSIVSTLCVKKHNRRSGGRVTASTLADWLSPTSSDKIASLPTPCGQMDRANEDSLCVRPLTPTTA